MNCIINIYRELIFTKLKIERKNFIDLIIQVTIKKLVWKIDFDIGYHNICLANVKLFLMTKINISNALLYRIYIYISFHYYHKCNLNHHSTYTIL